MVTKLTKSDQDFAKDRQQIRDAFDHISRTADLIKQQILKRNPHAFEHLDGHVNENRRNK